MCGKPLQIWRVNALAVVKMTSPAASKVRKSHKLMTRFDTTLVHLGVQ
jgi:hypothetical protein